MIPEVQAGNNIKVVSDKMFHMIPANHERIQWEGSKEFPEKRKQYVLNISLFFLLLSPHHCVCAMFVCTNRDVWFCLEARGSPWVMFLKMLLTFGGYFKISFIHFILCIFWLHITVHTYARCPWGSKEIGFPESGVTNGCEPLWGCWEWHLGCAFNSSLLSHLSSPQHSCLGQGLSLA